MRILEKNPDYLPVENAEKLREVAIRREKIEKLNNRELTQVAEKLLKALKS